jgi:hypothetical protein
LSGQWKSNPRDATLVRRQNNRASQYASAALQAEPAFLGIQLSPSFVRAPEGHGWGELHNREWLIGRHDFRPPTQARRMFLERREKLAA